MEDPGSIPGHGVSAFEKRFPITYFPWRRFQRSVPMKMITKYDRTGHGTCDPLAKAFGVATLCEAISAPRECGREDGEVVAIDGTAGDKVVT